MRTPDRHHQRRNVGEFEHLSVLFLKLVCDWFQAGDVADRLVFVFGQPANQRQQIVTAHRDDALLALLGQP